MILSHFSEKKVIFDSSFEYPENHTFSYKPFGLWLSDESESSVCSWTEWCLSNNFRPENLSVKQDFSVDLTEVLHLKNHKEIYCFTSEYQLNNLFSEEMMRYGCYHIDWKKLRHNFKGILITPYCFKSRDDFFWYYGWDCASGCFWDLSCLTEIE